MGRHKLATAAALAVLLLLAWMWPEGEEPSAGNLAANEPTASADSASESGGDGEAPDTDGQSPDGSGDDATTDGPQPSPEAPGSPSSAPVGDEYDGPLGTRNHTGSEAVALTFDDGPSPEWTPKVLEMLREAGVKATFCIIGAYAEEYPELVAQIVEEGHTLCNHSWYHEEDLGTRSEEEIRDNLQRTNDAILAAAPDAEIEYFRQPGGEWTQRVIDVAADMGMESLHWAVDPSDWDEDTTEAQIRKRVLDRTEPGSIILLHDGASNQKDMCAALASIFAEFERRGYAYTAL